MMRDHRLRLYRLRSVPISFCLIQFIRQRQLKPPLLDGTFKPTLPCWFAEAYQPFFALIAFNAWNTSWIMLLSRSGDSAISSLAAATQIQNAGCVRKSIVNRMVVLLPA
jgi:hypothetical protein